MICFRCHKKIEDKDNFYAMVEMNEGKQVKVDYVHRTCWDKFINQLDGASQSLKKSNFLLDAIGKKMMEVGFIKQPEQEVVI